MTTQQTQAKHTPGLWLYHADTQTVEIGGFEVYCADVAPNSATFDEAQANARLIAAAPDLLEWLKWALDQLQELGVANVAADKAIAAAEGR